MVSIGLREFKSLFKSVRTILIILAIFGITLGGAKLISPFEDQFESFGLGSNAYVGGLMVLLFIAGPLFVTSLSHSVINKEVDSRTIRFLATKTSRDNILIGKFIGHLLFWIICLFIALLLIIPFSHTFYFMEFIESIIFISYFLGLTLFLSTIIEKPALTMFLGIMLSVALPIIGSWSLVSDNLFIKGISYITPYFYYAQEQTYFTYFVLVFTCIYILLSMFVFRRRDL